MVGVMDVESEASRQETPAAAVGTAISSEDDLFSEDPDKCYAALL